VIEHNDVKLREVHPPARSFSDAEFFRGKQVLVRLVKELSGKLN